jgi:hypothetical protein
MLMLMLFIDKNNVGAVGPQMNPQMGPHIPMGNPNYPNNNQIYTQGQYNNGFNNPHDPNRLKKQNYFAGNNWPSMNNAIFPNTVNSWQSQQDIQNPSNVANNQWQPNLPNHVNPANNPWAYQQQNYGYNGYYRNTSSKLGNTFVQ